MTARGVKYCPAPPLTSCAVLLQQPLVGVALHVRRHRRPVLAADQLDDQPPQLSRVLNPVLRLLEDQPEHPALPAELVQRLAVVPVQLGALHPRRGEVLPTVAGRDRLPLAGEPLTLVGHLQEQQEGELLQVVLIGETVVAQDVAVRPELLDDPVRGVAHGARRRLIRSRVRSRGMPVESSSPQTCRRAVAGGRGESMTPDAARLVHTYRTGVYTGA